MAEVTTVSAIVTEGVSIAEKLNLTTREAEAIAAASNPGKTDEKVTLRAEINALVSMYNDAFQSARFEEAYHKKLQIEAKINEYTNMVRDECFKYLLEQESPMLEAVKMLSFQSIRTKERKEGDEKIPVMFIEDTDKEIKLTRLDSASVDAGKGSIAHDKNWYRMIEKLNFLLTARKAEEIGADPRDINDSFAMSKIAREIDLGGHPTSNTKLLEQVQMIISAMIGPEYKAKSHDVNFLLSIYSRKSRKALTVTCADSKYLSGYMAEICNHIVTGNPYKVEYKTIKQK